MAKALAIRSMRQALLLQRPDRDPFAAGGQAKPAWTDVQTVAASIVPMTGREYWQASQVQSDVTHQIETRWYPDVTTDWRGIMLHTGRDNITLNFASVVNVDMMDKWLIIMAVEASL